jgi:vacuolar-type H+-ATPase subunit B/Vma2
MMNAELAAERQMHVLVPIVYGSNYISALRALSSSAWPEPIIKTLVFAQRYVAAIPWENMRAAITVMTRTNAFVRPEDGDDHGIRIRISDATDLCGTGTGT